MMNKNVKTVVLVFTGIIAALLVWGAVGGIAAQDSGVTCDTGIGDVLCWNWHTNALGQVQDFFDGMANN